MKDAASLDIVAAVCVVTNLVLTLTIWFFDHRLRKLEKKE